MIVAFARVVRPSVPTFQNLVKQNKVKTMLTTGEIVGLAEWIIDDSHVLLQHEFARLFFTLLIAQGRSLFLRGKTRAFVQELFLFQG